MDEVSCSYVKWTKCAVHMFSGQSELFICLADAVSCSMFSGRSELFMCVKDAVSCSMFSGRSELFNV